MVIEVILDRGMHLLCAFFRRSNWLGGTFECTSEGLRIMKFRSSWDKRKITWGSCAYQIVPLHDKFRTQHWEDVLSLLVRSASFSHSYSQIWNGDDDDIDEIKEVGAEVIALNKKIAAGTF
jgi:hypothetical protein